MTIVVSMGRLSIQSFFAIGGFLLGIKFLNSDTELKFTSIIKAVIVRYIG